ncbi:MAG: nucleoside monophosphate kinase [Candidatus Paceibacterota bacterium]
MVELDPKLLTFIFIGRSGCGKGTQAQLVMDYIKQTKPLAENPILYIETGAHLREFIQGSSLASQKAKQLMAAKELQPSFVSNFIWSRILIEQTTGREHLIIDGSPRKLVEAQILDSGLSFLGRFKPKVVHLNVSREWSKDRLLGRGRTDDDVLGIEKRLDWFDEEVAPVIEFFRNADNFDYLDVNGEQTIDKVQQDILKLAQLK